MSALSYLRCKGNVYQMTTILTIKVFPQSGRQQFSWDAQRGILKCFLKNAPEKNKANNELLILLCKSLGISQECVAILGGHTSRTKRIKIESGLSKVDIYVQLGVEAGTQQGVPGVSSRS